MGSKVFKSTEIEREIGEATDDELALINKFTRKTLEKDDVYTFSMVLCGNEVDRDGEAFTDEALDKLAELFVGKTGICDHRWLANNQVARIFAAEVIAEQGETNAFGKQYVTLRAKAYIPRTKRTKSVIEDIDGGIKREISISCAIQSQTCSICGNPYYGKDCAHRKGHVYDGATCVAMLGDPIDAYEFSFVAVPAQTDAHVTKSAESEDNEQEENDLETKETGEKNLTEEAVKKERERIRDIFRLAKGVCDAELAQEAAFGENPLTAEQFAVKALERQAEQGAAILGEMEKNVLESGAEGIETEPNAGYETEAELDAQKTFDTERVKRATQ
ncbi:MAG: hypothetical protein LBB67_06745 [Oscillospiraceae bacterium]|nr:hypothetical protein [Oscillospiraceae bacterium]